MKLWFDNYFQILVIYPEGVPVSTHFLPKIGLDVKYFVFKEPKTGSLGVIISGDWISGRTLLTFSSA